MKLYIIIIFLILFSVSYAQTTEEYTLKAVYLEMLTRWIDWPDYNDPVNSDGFTLGVIGDSPFGKKLEYIYAKQKIKDKKVSIKYYNSYEDIKNCHLLFICSSESENLSSILRITRQKGILTISDSEGFAKKGVLINLYVSGKNVKFEINKQGLSDNGFKISPYLLKLGKIVHFMGGSL